MNRPTTSIVFMLTVSVLVFATVSCSKSPTAPAVSVQQDKSGNVVVLLTGNGDDSVWKKKDENNDIFVKKVEGDRLDINMKFTLSNGATRQIKTILDLEALPPGGEKVLIGVNGDKKIYIELQ